MSRENTEVVLRLFDAFNERDAGAVRGLWAADAEWRPAFIGGGLVEGAVYRGHEGVTEFIAIQDEAWESVVVEPGRIRDLGDLVLAEVHLKAIGRGSGIPVDRTTWNVFEVREGKVTAGRVYTTVNEALAVVGLEEE